MFEELQSLSLEFFLFFSRNVSQSSNNFFQIFLKINLKIIFFLEHLIYLNIIEIRWNIQNFISFIVFINNVLSNNFQDFSFKAFIYLTISVQHFRVWDFTFVNMNHFWFIIFKEKINYFLFPLDILWIFVKPLFFQFLPLFVSIKMLVKTFLIMFIIR